MSLIVLTILILICTITAAFMQAAGFSEFEAPTAKKAVWASIGVILLALAAKWLSHYPMLP